MQPAAAVPCEGDVSLRSLVDRWSGAIGALPLAPLAALFVFWVLCNPYFAIDASSLIYAARTLADLDPAGVGRDMMFVNDGQSGFTVFPWLMRQLASRVGLTTATDLVAAASVVAGFLGAVVFAWSVARGATRSLVVVFAATLPACYGGYKLFSYAEVAATPRPFVEALVLGGLVALIHRRHALAALMMAVGMVLHPIMALVGVAMLVCWLVHDDRRWLLLGPVLVAVIGAAALAGMPPFDRLTTVIDAEWRTILVERNPHLFPTLWPSGWIGRSAARLGSLLIAASLVAPPVRKIFVYAVLVGLLGLGVAYASTGSTTLLIVLQAQTWRMMWLVFALGTIAAAICAAQLWPRGGTACVTLGFLALSWTYADHDSAAVLFALVALGVHHAIDPEAYRGHRRFVGMVVALLAACVLFGLVATQRAFSDVVLSAPPGLAGEARRTLALASDYSPLAIIAAIVMLGRWPRPSRPVLIALTILGAVAAVANWDQRSAANRALDAHSGAAEIERIVAARPGEILWLDGDREAWWWLKRPQWLSAIQGAGIVFSRDLAMLYKDRAGRAIGAGLADDNVLTPISAPAATQPPLLGVGKVAAFCAASDAPSWIVAPLAADTPLPAGLAATEWIAPVAKLVLRENNGASAWVRLTRYAVLPCHERG